MDWKEEAINDLRQHGYKQASIKNIEDKIAAIDLTKESIKAVVTDTDPVTGGSGTQEDEWMNLICEQERLQYTKEATERLIGIVEGALKMLTPTERLVLEKFYIQRTHGHINNLMDELGYEQRQIYNIKDRALHKFTTIMYGITEY